MYEKGISPKWFIAFGAVVALVIAVAVFMDAASRMPSATIPTAPLPSPNGYDYYQSAADLLVDGEKVAFACENGFASMPSSPRRTVQTGHDPNDHVYSVVDMQALVGRNAAALESMRRGFAHDCRAPAARDLRSHPEYRKFRNMARLLCVEGQTRAARGEWGGAMDSYLDAMRFGAEVTRGPMIGMMVGVTVQRIDQWDAWKTVEHLNAGEAMKSAKRLEMISGRMFPFAKTLQEDKWSTQAIMLKAFEQPDWRASFFVMMGASPDTMQKIKSVTWTKRGTFTRYSTYMDESIEQAKRPYAVSKRGPIPGDIMSQLLQPIYQGLRFRHVGCQTQNTMLCVALALRAYKLEYGEYPPSLANLAPKYLAAVPDDPLAAKGPLKYKRNGNSYVLYSVGPDGKDDAGVPIGGPPSTTGLQLDQAHYVQRESVGDIVAGVNP